jgi:hypothetical protein
VSGKVDLDGYNTVAERIAEFRAKHPEGSLRPADMLQPYEVREIAGETVIVVVAAAYRTPDDPAPGIGMASEYYPGRTAFTRGSELMNAETSAWGRAIVAVLAADTQKGVASREEVRNRHDEDAPRRVSQQTPAQQRASRGAPPPRAGAERKRAIAHERLAASTRDTGGIMAPGPIPDEENIWQAPADYETAPGSIMDGQHRAIELLLTKWGIARDARDDRHLAVATLLELDGLGSLSDLSAAQAALAVRRIQDEMSRERADA